MTRWKKSMPNKIRKIKLVLESDDGFRSFITNIQLENYHLRASNERSHADIIAHPLEKTVREWAKLSGAIVDERILSYELLKFDNRYEKRYNEIDFIFRLDNKHYLAEVKVSSSIRTISKAFNQLSNAYKILSRADFKVELLIVHINLNYKNTETTFHQFNDDFLKTESTKLDELNLPCHYLQLKPQEIFEWGVKNGIILNAELLSKAIDESDYLHLNRIKRQELKDKKIPQDEWPDELKGEIKIQDNENHSVNFGNNSSPNLLAENLKEAFKNQNDEDSI
jgi:hypothetical protein